MSAKQIYGPFHIRPAEQLDEQLSDLSEKLALPLEPFDPRTHDGFLEQCARLVEAADVDVGSLGLDAELVIYVPQQYLYGPLPAEARILVSDLFARDSAVLANAMQSRIATIPIVETRERFQSIPEQFAAAGLPVALSTFPFSEACGQWANKPRVFWVREGLMIRLITLGRLCQRIGLVPHIEDAFRPAGVQEGLYERRVRWTRENHPDWQDADVLAEARSKTAYTPRLASHKAGAAVDLRLLTAGDQQFLDIGHEYPDGGSIVALDSPFVTQLQWINRHLLLVASHLAGMAMYPFEDWHLSFGDNLMQASRYAHGSVGTARYGPVREFDLATGRIDAIYSDAELDRPFF